MAKRRSSFSNPRDPISVPNYVQKKQRVSPGNASLDTYFEAKSELDGSSPISKIFKKPSLISVRSRSMRHSLPEAHTSSLLEVKDSDSLATKVECQQKIIDLQQGQINLYQHLFKSIKVDPEDTAMLDSFSTEIERYQNTLSRIHALPPPSVLKKQTCEKPLQPECSQSPRWEEAKEIASNKKESYDDNAHKNYNDLHVYDEDECYNIHQVRGSYSAPLDIESDEDIQPLEKPIPPTIFSGDIELLLSSEPESDIELEAENHVQKEPGSTSDKNYNIINDQKSVSDIEETEAFDISTTLEPMVDADNNKTFSWTKDVMSILKNTFKLQGFRPNQLRSINATIEGRDVFLLMPTGGGKSLCYQLPALVQSGPRKGPTIVISPLIALMHDQISSLKSRGISCDMMSADLKKREKKEVVDRFVGNKTKLLYISPEMFNINKQLRSTIQDMAEQNRLARIVIDEAHCVSSWGHDFRPDYKMLENIKYDFPNVPIMALTATANERVRFDILRCLRQNNTLFLKQSFNRENLFLEVREKTSSTILADIKDLIDNRFRNQSGIIYCYSRALAERTAEQLHAEGLRVMFYHGSMSRDQRDQVQKAWQSGKLQAICATTAFGMGIDKADVRFVFHFTMPRNIEGYYQEVGRAGRDGLRSECILFYSHKDAVMLLSLINRDDFTREIRANHVEKLRDVVTYCENGRECRKKQLLNYFGETFDVRQCRRTCDNCKKRDLGDTGTKTKQTKRELKDMTDRAQEIIELVRSIEQKQVTIAQCIEVYRGSKNKKLQQKGIIDATHNGAGKSEDKGDVEKLFSRMTLEGILDDYSVYQGGYAQSYICVGRKAEQVLHGSLKVKIFVDVESDNKTSTKRKSGNNDATTVVAINGPAIKDNVGDDNTLSSIETLSSFKAYAYSTLLQRRTQLKTEFSAHSVNDICSNTTLKDMAQRLPTDLESFETLRGVTQVQVETYYNHFRPELVRLCDRRRQIEANSLS